MALAGELMRYIGNELVPMATKTAGSALSSILPSAVAKAGTSLATKAGTGALRNILVNKVAQDTSPYVPVVVNGKVALNNLPGYSEGNNLSLRHISNKELPNLGVSDLSHQHGGVLFASQKGSKIPVVNGKNVYFGGLDNAKVLDLTDEDTALALSKAYKYNLEKSGAFGDSASPSTEIANQVNQIQNGITGSINRGDILNNLTGDDMVLKGNSDVATETAPEFVLTNNDMVQKANFQPGYKIPDTQAFEQAKKYLPEKPKYGLDEYGMGTIDLRGLNDQKQVSLRASVPENQASLFDQLDAPSDVKIRARNYLDKTINWADDNPAFNKLTPAQRQSFADLAVEKLGDNPTTYDVNQLFDPFYKNARKENGLALFNSDENQGFLNRLGIKDYTTMKGTLANEGEHTYTLSKTTGLPYNEKITLNASVMEDMLNLQSTELHEAAHAAWLRLSPEQKISIGQDLCNKFGVNAQVGKRIASSNDLNELIAYSCEANFANGNMVGADGKLLDRIMNNSTAQRHLDNVAKMAGDTSVSFKERVMNVIRAFVDYVKAKIKGIKDIGTFDEFYDGLSNGDFAKDLATPIEKWAAPAKTDVELAKDELFNKLASLQKSRSIDSKAFLDIADMFSPDTDVDYVMNYINTNYPDVAEKLASVVDKKASEGLITLYHGTPNKFEDFDDTLPSVWFSDSDKNLRDTGLSIKGGQSMNIMERQLPKDLKIADEELADRLTKQQLQDRGYAGIAYSERGPNGDETYYEIFKPNETLIKKIADKKLDNVE